MTEKKITKRERFVEIAGILAEGGYDELVEVINHEVELLDKKAAKAKETAAKKSAANDALTETVKNALTDELATIADITAVVSANDETITKSKIQYRLNTLVKSGFAVKEQVTVGEGEAKHKLMAYAIAADSKE